MSAFVAQLLTPPSRHRPSHPVRPPRRLVCAAAPHRPATSLDDARSDAARRANNSSLRAPAPVPPPPQLVHDDAYARICIWVLRTALWARTGLHSTEKGYKGLVAECHMLQHRASPVEQRAIVHSLLQAAVIPPIGVSLFRHFFSHRPEVNADVTPKAFAWLVGDAERNTPECGGEGVLIKQCRFLDDARCKGLYVSPAFLPTTAPRS